MLWDDKEKRYCEYSEGEGMGTVSLCVELP
jgi:hypothetical protein